MAFDSDLTSGEALNGSISALWLSPVFDPSTVNSLDLLWGTNNDEFGVLLTSVPVPEPSGTTIMGLGVLLMAIRRRRH